MSWMVPLSEDANENVRRMGEAMCTNHSEVVRRGLILLDLYLGLRDDEELVVRNNVSGECERLRFVWDTVQ